MEVHSSNTIARPRVTVRFAVTDLLALVPLEGRVLKSHESRRKKVGIGLS